MCLLLSDIFVYSVNNNNTVIIITVTIIIIPILIFLHFLLQLLNSFEIIFTEGGEMHKHIRQ